MITAVALAKFSDNCRCRKRTVWLGWRESQAKDLASPREDRLMLIQHESPASSGTVVAGPSHKLLQLVRKRLRQLLRVTIALVICLAATATALAIWRLTSLNDLPDIGDPFDVAAFRDFRVPDEQNAFTFLRRAQESLTPAPPSVGLSWSQADPKSREWVQANRRAIELFQQGADQADATNPHGDSVVDGQRMALLVLLEAGRRQESGDMARAWDCYRAILRMATHTRRRGSLYQRADLYVYWDGLARERFATWAADPRTTIPQLNVALQEVLKSEPKPEWDSFAIKAGYLAMMRSLKQSVRPFVQQDVGWEYDLRLGDMQLSPDMADYLDAGRRFLLREPERSRRVLQLLYANWLAHVEPGERGPRKPAVRASFALLKSTNPTSWSRTNVSLYSAGPAAPASARLLTPKALASWLVATNDAKLRIIVANSIQWPWSPDHLRDRKAHRDLVVMLAGEIYRRERGTPPPSEEALVGTYLKSLPDDGSADLDDGTALVIE
jgi:hypothetical protein